MADKKDEPYQRIKVTLVAYYEPKLGPDGPYWEPGGEYSRGIALANTVAEAAAYDYFSYREGHISTEEYLGFADDDSVADYDLKVEVVTCLGRGETYEEVCTSDISKKIDEQLAFDFGAYDEKEREGRSRYDLSSDE